MENFNMVCGLNMRNSMTTKVTKGPPYCHYTFGWTPKPRKKNLNTPAHLWTEKGGSKGGFWVTCGQDLGYLSAGFRLELADTYEEIL